MSYIDAKVKKQFDTLSPELQRAILDQNVNINTLQDLIRELEKLA